MHTGDTKMDFLLDKIEYSVAQFHEEFGHRLPVMAEVTQGFSSEITQDTFDIEQVILIHTESRQKRVVMETRNTGTKQSFSIPVTYHAKFCIVNKHGKAGKGLSLAEITSKQKLPVTVQFAKKEAITVGNRHTSTSYFPKMQLVKIFVEMHLLGNFVNDGEFTQPVVPIPLYPSQMRLSAIAGIRGQEKGKFKYLLERFAHFAEQLTYDQEFGNTEIAVYGQDTIPKDAVYQYVQPQMNTGLATFLKQHGHAGQSDAAGQAYDNVYEEIKTYQAGGQHTKETKPPKYTPTQTQRTEKVDLSDAAGQAYDNVYEEIKTNQAGGQHTKETKPPKYTPTQTQRTEKVDLSDAAGQAYDNVYEEIKTYQAGGQHTKETKPPKYTPTQTQRTEKVDLSDAAGQAYDNVYEEIKTYQAGGQHTKETKPPKYTPTQTQRTEKVDLSDAAGQAGDNMYKEINTHQAGGQHTKETKPPKYTPTQTQRTEKVDLSGLPDRTPPIVPRKTMKPSTTRQNAAPPIVQPPSIPRRAAILPCANMTLSDRPTAEAANVPYANAIPRGHIRPTVKFRNTPKEVETVPNVTPLAEYDGIIVADGVDKRVTPDVQPESDKVFVSGLRIEEVCEWMKYLQLDKYCEQFREQMIDGEMLRELDKDILSSVFGLNPVESLRLTKFAKEGYIPM